MGQESLNFNFEEPKNRNYAGTISIRDRLSKKSDIEQTRAIEARDIKKNKYNFLEDVPEEKSGEIERKIQKFNFSKFLKSEHRKSFFYDGMAAAMEVRDLNEKYGSGSATYVSNPDGAGRMGYRISYNTPLKAEFEDILDINGSILPSKNEHEIAS